MSADLLRRAAQTIREHVAALSFGGGWAVCLSDSEVTTADGGVMIADTFELAEGRPDASYIALMHPPVALALAAAMDEVAFALQIDSGAVGRVGYPELIACAREVLREPEESGR